MPFSKPFLRPAALTLAILLAGCATSPSEMEPETPTAAPQTLEQQASDRDAPAGLDITAPDQNPYLAQTREVPANAADAFGRAVTAMQAGKWLEAESILQQLTSKHPDLSGPFLNLGIVYRQLDQRELAEQAFAQAIQVNSLNLNAYNQIALLKREAGDFAAAEQYYRDALAVWSKHAASHRNLGILYDLYMGRLEEALQHFEIYQYLQEEPDREVTGWIIDLKRRIQEATR